MQNGVPAPNRPKRVRPSEKREPPAPAPNAVIRRYEDGEWKEVFRSEACELADWKKRRQKDLAALGELDWFEWVRWGDGYMPEHIAQHLLKLRDLGKKSIANIVATGQALQEMKGHLSHGVWLWVFERKLLPYRERTAQMYMSIAKHPVLSNPHNYALLPPTLNALYLLSRRLPAEIVKRLIESGAITAATRIEDVANLSFFKLPQLLGELGNLVAAYDPTTTATMVSYELWRDKQNGVRAELNALIAWLTDFDKAYEQQEEAHGKEWQAWVLADAREAERERRRGQELSAASAQARITKEMAKAALKRLEKKGEPAQVVIEMPNREITHVITYRKKEKKQGRKR